MCLSHSPVKWMTWGAAVFLAPILAVAVSVVYFRASARVMSLGRRVAVSVHGLSIALLYTGAWIVLLSGQSGPRLCRPFAWLLLLPLLTIGVSFRYDQGFEKLRLLQVINLLCFLWTGFVGSILVTGVSL
jgi:hypothetical protein